jgi:hypothetical protein
VPGQLNLPSPHPPPRNWARDTRMGIVCMLCGKCINRGMKRASVSLNREARR